MQCRPGSGLTVCPALGDSSLNSSMGGLIGGWSLRTGQLVPRDYPFGLTLHVLAHHGRQLVPEVIVGKNHPPLLTMRAIHIYPWKSPKAGEVDGRFPSAFTGGSHYESALGILSLVNRCLSAGIGGGLGGGGCSGRTVGACLRR